VSSTLLHYGAAPSLPPIRLDTIGLTGFSYNFASLDDKKGPVTSAFEAFETSNQSSISIRFVLLMRRFPVLFHLPILSGALLNEVNKATVDISKALFEKAKKEKEGSLDEKDHSIIGLLSAPLSAGRTWR